MNEIKTRSIINRNFIKTKLKLKIIKTKNQNLKSTSLNLSNLRTKENLELKKTKE